MEIIIIVVILVIASVISVCRDEKSKSNLAKALSVMGFNISEKLDIPDINADNKPYCFLIDRTNKKWFLANYKANYAEPFDYVDIVDYHITYRLKGTDIVKGREFSGAYSEFTESKAKILDIVDLNSENCEYIAFSITYGGKAIDAQIANKFVLFENQEGNFVYAKNHDFVVPSACITNAKDFENLLFEILNENTKHV